VNVVCCQVEVSATG